jgi:ferredoxin
MGGAYVDPQYAARRDGVFIVAVNCGQAGATCFCASMGTGPRADKGFDLSLTEVLEGDTHHFVVEVGSPSGLDLLAEVPHRDASTEEIDRAERVTADTALHMGRKLETGGLKELLYAGVESAQWEEIAQRCLTCGNCTMVCPTCFCTTVEDVTDLAGLEAERVRKWDSCFTSDFSYLHGGSVRVSPRSRYRQWMTHKLASWQDQFGTSGCVGCGRCITWCPVGIDITREAARMREEEMRNEK